MLLTGIIALLLSVPAAPAAGTEISFLPAPECGLCHARIEAAGHSGPVGQFPLWGGSMMAHASRDPYWKAKVRSEAALTPAAARIIEDKCLRCHAPSQQYGYRGRGESMPLSALARDGGEGVTCTVCHQIGKDGLGTRESFTGGFRIGTEKRIYGPHPDPFQMPMLHHTGYTATESKHMLEASLCGTCHTVITPTLAPDGKVLGEFVEQAPYLEWLAGDFSRAGVSCQSCHVPPLDDGKGQRVAQHIAHRPPGGPFPPTSPRSPFGLHFFAGANAAMLDLFAARIPEEKTILERAGARARQSLASSLELHVNPKASAGLLQVTVEVRNLTGHKLPTGFPSRRLWLEVRILDGAGKPLFESGAWSRQTGELLAGPAQPHRNVIADPRHAMVYETAYLDSNGRGTMSLLRAARHGKDNRILPRGFDPAKLPEGLRGLDIRSAGTVGDAGFRPGSHSVRYEYRPKAGERPAKVTVAAWYQSIAPAHAAALEGDHGDIRAFRAAYPGARMPVPAGSREVALSPFPDE